MASSFENYNKRRLISSYFSVVLSIFLVLFLLGTLGLFVINSKKISDDFTEKDSRVDFSKYKNGGFNPNKTKTFYSRSYKISKFIENKKLNNIGTNEWIRDVFDIANEISEKVNHFIRFDINQTISNFENNINSK